ncbi:WD40/YVTN/BNR-like repeat-containing protein [Flavobacterium sp. '19STA2R22 D10 B1']|uniref:WD40/YVTN/BNR-like repeat-containing protein n=1 Tax=Flavobacterium aerium TaxID=3037261 RepID=UPI00278BD2B3|nr:oxidoreductase [Flavobacterium sp. '19STA2R22 D10 B1']
MKHPLYLAILFVGLFSCKNESKTEDLNTEIVYNQISVDTLYQDTISIRAIAIDSNRVWYAGNHGQYGYRDFKKEKNFKGIVAKDSLALEFRAIAQTKTDVFILTVGNPALLYKISKDGTENRLVYQEHDEKVFYDSMQFWNNKEGIAMGDPMNGCLSIIVTTDGGETWVKKSCEGLPKIEEGEGAFAASNTNLIIRGDKTWMVTGGKKSRIFVSTDKAKTWKAYQTPITEGKTMTGIFSADFYDQNQGIIVGGDYEKQQDNFSNKAITTNGGKSWELIADKSAFGYTSCVQYVPNTNGKGIVTVGASGLYYSADGGTSWKQLSTDKELYTIRFQNETTAIAAGKNKIIRINFKA